MLELFNLDWIEKSAIADGEKSESGNGICAIRDESRNSQNFLNMIG